MDSRDWELLNTQMDHCQPPARRDGVLVLGMVAVFLAGLSVGGLLFPMGSQPAPSDGKTALAVFLSGSRNATR
jgi:hypothetical protein